jgi:hypothetical protein
MTYTELQTSIADWLLRPDLIDVTAEFIANAEARLNRDPRVRSLTTRTDFVVDEDGEDIPADLRSVDSWYLDGPTFYGPLQMVSGAELSRQKQHGRLTGVPTHAAIMGRKAYFAPVPDAEYTTRLSYWRRVPALSLAEPTNWLLDEHQDIYRLAALVESAPYLKDDARLPMWEEMLNGRLEDMNVAASQEAYSGTLIRQFRPIG